MSNITQIVNKDKNMTTLKKGVHASDLDQLLSSTGPFTMFAPSNLAFEKLQGGTMENLLAPENKTALTGLMNTHVVSGKIAFSELKDGEKLTNLQGRELAVTISGDKVSIDGARILVADIKTTNGVVYLLDTVLKD